MLRRSYAATIYVRIGLGDFLSRLLAALNGTEVRQLNSALLKVC